MKKHRLLIITFCILILCVYLFILTFCKKNATIIVKKSTILSYNIFKDYFRMEVDSMATISNFILCEDIQNQVLQTENGATMLQPNIVSPLTVISPISVPGNYSFAMFGVMSGYNKDVANEVNISIVDPNDNECFSTPGIQIPCIPNTNADRFNFSINLRNFVFKTEGNYKIIIKLNHAACFEKEFEVIAKGL